LAPPTTTTTSSSFPHRNWFSRTFLWKTGEFQCYLHSSGKWL
uniref:PH domain-containing protein n=1 Tax=Mesocestoides corti TaxID=53468 RepID=A0A0R3UD14_MESCO